MQSKRATFSQGSPLSTQGRKLLKCAIYESTLADTFIISVDQSGEVLGVSMATDSYCSGIEVPSANLTDWNTKVEISVSVSGTVPDTQSYIDKIKKDEREKAKGTQADNRSFFSKYWMYIVPFVIMMFIMQSMDPQQGGGGGGR